MLPQTNNLLSEEITPLSSQGHQAARRGAWRIAADLPSSFRYAAQGLAYGIVSQRNFRIHVVIGAVVFGLGLSLQLNLNDLAVLVLTVAAVLVLELLNTSIEAVVDLAIGRRFHPLARIAKDTAYFDGVYLIRAGASKVVRLWINVCIRSQFFMDPAA